jgi:hypothetical protein
MLVLMHGYTIDSDLPLYLPPAPADSRADMTIRYGGVRAVSWDVPPGELIADVRDPATGTFYSFARADGRLLLRFQGAAEIEADDRLTQLTAFISPDFDAALLSVLVTGAIVAARLVLDERLVLHASALEVDGGAVAFVGKSGMGKSTMCALGTAAGFALVGDDVLRVDIGAGSATIWPAATETRLRASAAGVIELFGKGAARTTADGRTAVQATTGVDGPLALAVCVVPFPSRDITRVSVARLPPAQALARLLSFPRLVGWLDPRTSAVQFQRLADLCERVPVVEARLPWGPPFHPRMFVELVEELATVRAASAASPGA